MQHARTAGAAKTVSGSIREIRKCGRGTFVLFIGCCVAFFRRASDFLLSIK